jgi:hypothetical protein
MSRPVHSFTDIFKELALEWIIGWNIIGKDRAEIDGRNAQN